MRKIILNVAVSLDGFIEGPNKEIDWIVFDAEGGNALNAFAQEIDTILYGRVSYEGWGNYTPPADADTFDKNFYATTGKMTKYVFSSTKDKFEGNPTVIHSNIAERMHQLKQQPGKSIWLFGGGVLITTFMNLGLVDEFRLAVMPVIIGSGTPLFKDIKDRLSLKLTKAAPSTAGVMELWYEKVK
jgi:dihydrofolate reductase